LDYMNWRFRFATLNALKAGLPIREFVQYKA
jgi:hypothetical protein